MLGFRQLQRQIDALDYQSLTPIMRALKRLEDYTREAKERRDGPGRREAEKTTNDWLAAVSAMLEPANKTPSGQTAVQTGNLLRTRTALKQLRVLF